MLDNLGFAVAFLCFLLGAALLYDGVHQPDANQALKIVSAAALLSLGLISNWLLVKNKLEWRRNYKKYREGL